MKNIIYHNHIHSFPNKIRFLIGPMSFIIFFIILLFEKTCSIWMGLKSQIKSQLHKFVPSGNGLKHPRGAVPLEMGMRKWVWRVWWMNGQTWDCREIGCGSCLLALTEGGAELCKHPDAISTAYFFLFLQSMRLKLFITWVIITLYLFHHD